VSALRLCIYCLAFIGVEIVLYFSYRHHDARFHWFVHFFVGASVALLGMSLVAWRTRRAVRFPLIWILVGHLFAMAPDLLFYAFSIIHRSWMDVFLWHIGAHFIPGRNWTWLGIFVASLAIYLWNVAKVEEAGDARMSGAGAHGSRTETA
jgi:hypothetical protein